MYATAAPSLRPIILHNSTKKNFFSISEPAMEKSRVAGGRKLTRQKSRLQMHAPSSIEVVPASASVAEWNVAIPLLSPLDVASLPAHWDPTAEKDQGGDKREPSDERRRREDEDRVGTAKWSTWQHPAEPFYYEPAGGNGPAILLPHCA